MIRIRSGPFHTVKQQILQPVNVRTVIIATFQDRNRSALLQQALLISRRLPGAGTLG